MLKHFMKPLVAATMPLVLATVLVGSSTAEAAVATWSPNREPDIAGYRLSYGTQSGVHTVVIDVGNVTTYTFNPPPGRRYYVVVEAYNTAGLTSEKSVEVAVDVPAAGPNSPPTLQQPLNQVTTVNTSASLLLSGGDPDGGTLTYRANGLPPGLSISATSGLITGVPTTAGTFQVTATVSDETLSAGRTFTWTVVASTPGTAPNQPPGTGPNQPPGAGTPNRPPKLETPANQKTLVNTLVSLAVAATDPEAKPLKFTASNLPPGLSIDGASGVIAGRPTTIGSYVITLTVSDGSLSDSQNFSWQITGPSPPGTAPQRESAVDSPIADDHVGVTGDFDGDGRLELATYNSGKWRIWFSGSGARESMVFEYGTAGDVAMPADYDGDRVTDFAVYRPSTGDWHLWLSRSQTATSLHWGVIGDTPITVDFDGDGRADLGLIRNGGVDILLSRSNYTSTVSVR